MRFRAGPFNRPPDHKSYSQVQAFQDSKFYAPKYFNMNSDNEKQALFQRVLKDTPRPTTILMAFEHFVRKNLHKIIQKKKIRSDSMDTYLKGSNASPAVKRMVREAHETNLSRGINEHSSLSSKILYAWSTRKSFVKVENLTHCTEAGELDKAPRLIQGAKSEFISIVGPWFSAFQRHAKKCMGKDSCVYFTSGASSREMGDYISTPGHIFENDVSAYDSSIGVRLCELEVWIAKQFGAPRAVIDLMVANINTHGFTATGWQYRVPGTRKSGDPYTSVFNSILNAFMHLFVYQQLTELPFDQIKESVKLLVQGDDMLMRHGGIRLSTKRWYELFLELGFKTESRYREHIREAEFCSSVIVPSQDGLTFIPKIGKVLAKFGYFVNPPRNVHPKALLRGVALGIKNLDFVPVYRNLIDAVLRCTEGHKAYHYRIEEHKYRFTAVTASPEADYCVAERYGLTSRQLKDVEVSLSKLHPGAQLSDPLLRCIMDKDSDGPKAIYASAA